MGIVHKGHYAEGHFAIVVVKFDILVLAALDLVRTQFGLSKLCP